MSHDVLGEVVVQAAQDATEFAVRRYGWKGCAGLTIIAVGIGVGAYFLLF